MQQKGGEGASKEEVVGISVLKDSKGWGNFK